MSTTTEGAVSGTEGQEEEEGVTLESLRRKMAEFARERDWEQFHSPRNLLFALVLSSYLSCHFSLVFGARKDHLLWFPSSCAFDGRNKERDGCGCFP